MSVSRHLLLVAITATSLAVVGCSPTPGGATTSSPTRTVAAGSSTSASPTASASASASSSPSPAPEPAVAAEPAAVVVGVTSIQVLDATGSVLYELSFRSPAVDVAATLSGVFGSPPTETDTPAGPESWPVHNYDWGGFVLRDQMTGKAPTDVYYWDYTVFSKTANINGITIRTSGGTFVGEPSASFAFDGSPWGTWTASGQTCGSEITYSPTGRFQNSVILMVCLDNKYEVVTSFTSPQPMQV